jgi:hypothetical protein
MLALDAENGITLWTFAASSSVIGRRHRSRGSLERMRQELREPQRGGFLVAQNLAYRMLIQALRLHLAGGLEGGVGWLFALADRQMSAAINAMHDDPGRRVPAYRDPSPP